MLIGRPRGTHDVLPRDSVEWRALEQTARQVCSDFGYEEIRTPIFEETDLFVRTVGEASDLVRKEMYTFLDRGGRSVTLRPEGTAPVVRAYLENKLFAGALPEKLYYLATPMFRYERPQAGRYRQHHQFGAEVIGSQDPGVDAELISLPLELFRRLGMKGLHVKLNSIGCPECRPLYRERLRDYFRPLLDRVCADCRDRFERNPLRMLDCKQPSCRSLHEGAPRSLDALCPACADHFAELRSYLDRMDIRYRLEPRLVRGLDYYTKTVFEISYRELGSQDAVCGGGRYDGLVERLGGEPTPAAGFGLGMERLLVALHRSGIRLAQPLPLTVFVATAGATKAEAVRLVKDLRAAGIRADMDYLGRSLRRQMRYADRYPANFVVILGEEELATGQVKVRSMTDGEERQVSIDELFAYVSGTSERSPTG